MPLVGKRFADLSDDLSQPGVAHHQPAAGSDAIGLVLELVRLHLVEVLEAAGKSIPRFCKQSAIALLQFTESFITQSGALHSRFEDVGVNLGHAVDGVGAHDAQVGHVDPLLSTLLNE